MQRIRLAAATLTVLIGIATNGFAQVPDGAQGVAAGLPAAAAADTVRTNLWLVEALMAEVASEGIAALPRREALVRLDAKRESPGNELFRVVAGRALSGAGYTVLLPAAAPSDTVTGTPDFAVAYDVLEVDLAYPEVGRTLGLWTRWVARSVGVTVTLEVTERPSGRLLLSDRFTRGYRDRMDKGHLKAVDSDVYEFTSAETSASGWQSRTEEIIVLSALAGLIAVYFSNTGN